MPTILVLAGRLPGVSYGMRAAVLVVLLAACGDDLAAPPPDASAGFLLQLQGMPGVADAIEVPTVTAGFHYYVLHFAQPVDHSVSGGPTFLQEVSLLHRDTIAPLIVYTTGYYDYELDYADELTSFLGGNQISIEHRFFGTSRPDPVDWSKLTIEQMADDEHAIITAFKTVYTGHVITGGGSKGGMTAVFHRRFFPDDVDGTVAYVAPISFASKDERYPPFLASIGTASCRAGIQSIAIELLSNRRAVMEQRTKADAATTGHTFTRVALGAAVEEAINDLEWNFWQYHGAQFCGNMPLPTDSDDKLYAYLVDISAPTDNSDQSIVAFEPYYYQTDNQLGYPDDATTYLDPYRKYSPADYTKFLPVAKPAYDNGVAMHDIDDFVQHGAARVLFIYGAFDPWTGGAFQLGTAPQDSLLLTVNQGSHNANLRRLSDADRAVAFAALGKWTGATPVVVARVEPVHREPHVPSVLRHALRARGR